MTLYMIESISPGKTRSLVRRLNVDAAINKALQQLDSGYTCVVMKPDPTAAILVDPTRPARRAAKAVAV